MEALGFAELVGKYAPPVRKVDFLSVNNDFGRGATDKYGAVLGAKGIATGRAETMAPDATDLSAQLAALRQSDGDMLFITTGVEQLTLAMRQAVEQRVGKRIVSTGGSFPDQLIANPLPPGSASDHVLFYAPWFPEQAVHPKVAEAYTAEWNKRGWEFAGLTEGFRGYDAVLTAVEAIRIAGRPEAEAIREALWKVDIQGVNGDIRFQKEGPAGRESGQNKPNVYIVRLADGKTSML